MSTESATVPIWSFARRVDRRGREDSELLSVYRDHGVVPKSSRDDNFNKESEDLSNYLYVEQGDLVLNKMKTWQGSLAVSKFEGIVSPAYFVCQLSRQVEPRFIHYLLRSEPLIAEYAKRSKGIRPNQWDLPFDEFKAIEVMLPQVEEQRRIADFLDDQVARIDELIQSRLRQQTLHQESFVDQVQHLTSAGAPSAWRVAHAFMTGSGTTPKSDHPEYFEGATPWVMSGDLNDGYINGTEKSVSDEALAAFSALKVYPPGTLLVAMYGATVGRTGLLGVSACVNQAVCALQERGPISAEYAQYWFIARRSEIIELASGGGQPNVSQEIVRNLRITTGDENWQRDRLHSIKEMARQIDDLITTERRSGELLEERKRALITAAVTGELDVTTAKPIGMGRWVPNVGAGVDAPVVSQASSIGGIG